jgi:multiple sugar transport system substrate-binding protein
MVKMKKMKRRDLVRSTGFLASGGLGTMLAACGTVASSPARSATPTGPVELVHFNSTGIQSQPPFQQAIAEFEKRNPDIKVNLLLVPTGAADKFRAMIAGGETPDVTYIGVADLREMGPSALEPLNAYMTRDKVNVASYRSASANAVFVDGRYYALPLGINPNAMFYNVDLFKRAGIQPPPRSWNDKTWTWERFLDMAQRLTKAAESPTTSQWGWLEWGDWGDQIALVQAGGQWFDSRIKATKCVCGSAEGGRGLQFVQDMIYRYRVHPAPQDKAAFGGVDRAFASGQVAMTNGDWKMATTLVAPIQDFQWAAAQYPIGPSGKPTTTVKYLAAGMSGTSKYKDQAWKLQRWLTWDKEGVSIHTQGATMAAVKHVDPKDNYPLKDHLADAQIIVDGTDVGTQLYDAVGVTTQMNSAKSAEMNKLYANTQNGLATAQAIERAINALF